MKACPPSSSDIHFHRNNACMKAFDDLYQRRLGLTLLMFQNCLPAKKVSKSNAKALVKRHNAVRWAILEHRWPAVLLVLAWLHLERFAFNQNRLNENARIKSNKERVVAVWIERETLRV